MPSVVPLTQNLKYGNLVAAVMLLYHLFQ